MRLSKLFTKVRAGLWDMFRSDNDIIIQNLQAHLTLQRTEFGSVIKWYKQQSHRMEIAHRQEQSRASSQLDEARNTIALYQADVRSLEMQMKALKKTPQKRQEAPTMRRIMTHVDSVQRLRGEHTKEKEHLQAQHTATVKSLESDYQVKLKEQVASAVAETEKRVREDVKAQMQAAKTAISEDKYLRSKLAILQNRVAQHNKELARVRRQCELTIVWDAQRRETELKYQIKLLEGKNDATEKRVTKLAEALRTSRQSNSQLKEQLARKERVVTCAKCDERGAAARAKEDELSSIIGANLEIYEAKIGSRDAQVKANISTYERELRKRDRKLQSLERVVDDKSTRMTALEADNAELRARLAAAENKLAETPASKASSPCDATTQTETPAPKTSFPCDASSQTEAPTEAPMEVTTQPSMETSAGIQLVFPIGTTPAEPNAQPALSPTASMSILDTSTQPMDTAQQPGDTPVNDSEMAEPEWEEAQPGLPSLEQSPSTVSDFDVQEFIRYINDSPLQNPVPQEPVAQDPVPLDDNVGDLAGQSPVQPTPSNFPNHPRLQIVNDPAPSPAPAPPRKVLALPQRRRRPANYQPIVVNSQAQKPQLIVTITDEAQAEPSTTVRISEPVVRALVNLPPGDAALFAPRPEQSYAEQEREARRALGKDAPSESESDADDVDWQDVPGCLAHKPSPTNPWASSSSAPPSAVTATAATSNTHKDAREPSDVDAENDDIYGNETHDVPSSSYPPFQPAQPSTPYFYAASPQGVDAENEHFYNHETHDVPSSSQPTLQPTHPFPYSYGAPPQGVDAQGKGKKRAADGQDGGMGVDEHATSPWSFSPAITMGPALPGLSSAPAPAAPATGQQQHGAAFRDVPHSELDKSLMDQGLDPADFYQQDSGSGGVQPEANAPEQVASNGVMVDQGTSGGATAENPFGNIMSDAEFEQSLIASGVDTGLFFENPSSQASPQNHGNDDDDIDAEGNSAEHDAASTATNQEPVVEQD
ncbi:MAG: hypothetical protein L6R39_005423 [Caloplaca ligustica]|nr:MAG: hypothetical protein L6R39_005423 [Caloplaca ligustica]